LQPKKQFLFSGTFSTVISIIFFIHFISLQVQNLPAIKRIFLANTISGIAQGISIIAVPWYFANIYNRAGLWMIIYAIANIFGLLWSMYSGTLIDRLDRKKLFVGENVAGAWGLLTVAFIGLMYGGVPPILAAGVFTLTILIFSTHYPAQFAFIQEVLRPEEYGKITSYLEIQGQLTSVISGAAAALLLTGIDHNLQIGGLSIPVYIPKLSLAHIFLFDGITYVITWFIVNSITYRPVIIRRIDEGTVWERYEQGFSYFAAHPMQFLFGNASFTIFLTILLSAFALNPSYVTRCLNGDSWVYGMSEISFAIGAIFSGIFIRRIFAGHSPLYGIIGLSLLCGICYMFLGSYFSILLFIGLFLLIGLCNAGARILRFQYTLITIPNRVIGRTGGVVMAINFLLRILFGFIFSIPFLIVQVHLAYLLFSLLCILSAALLFIYRYRLNEIYYSSLKQRPE